MESAQNAAKASGEGAARQLKPGYCPQNAATTCGKGAARHLEAGKCLTLLSEATRKAFGKRPAKASGEGAAGQLKPGYCHQNAATACRKGAARHLEASKWLTLLSEATRKALGKRSECCKSLRRRRREALKPGYCPQNAATACGKGAARHLEAGKCLTLLSEATRKALGKRPECCKSLPRRRRRMAFEARLLPPEKLLESAQNAAKASGEGAAGRSQAKCSKSWQGRREAFGGCECCKGKMQQKPARHLEAGKCLTLLSEATRKALGKRPECCKSLRRRRRGAKPGYCPQNAATACGKGAARHLEAGKCLTLLSEALEKLLASA